MLDKQRMLSKIDELNSYVAELKAIMPEDYESYSEDPEKRRACERLLQISIETIIDICMLLAKGLSLGVPSSEEDIFEKLGKKKIITSGLEGKLKGMKGFRNVLAHHYADVDDGLVYENLKSIDDFSEFKEQIVKFIKTAR